jgi:hypothetical protein
MRDVRTSVEVRALIGAGKLRELRGGGFAEYECWQCGRPGRTTEPTSVIVLAHRVFRVARLAHASCADPQIIAVGTAGMWTAANKAVSRGTGKPGGFAEAGSTWQRG